MTTIMSVLAASAVGLLSGAHASIWGVYKDAPHEGFGRRRFARSMIVGGISAAMISLLVGVVPTSPEAVVVLFGLAYAIERGIVEVWKTFVRDEDQSKYFIPMQFTIRGVPVSHRGLRGLVGSIVVAFVAACVAGLARIDVSDAAHSASTLIGSGVVAGVLVAIGGAWKDAPKEGFDPVKFCRSPAMTVTYTLLLSSLTGSVLHAAVAAIGFERATAETYKTFFFPNRPRGKFAGKPILFPEMLVRRRRLVPVFAAIWAIVLASGALAFVRHESSKTTTHALAEGAGS